MIKNKISVIGAGDIGFTITELLAVHGYDVYLQNRYHEVDGKPSPYWLNKLGKIMDMNDSIQIPGAGKVELTHKLEDLDESYIIVITAGAKRSSIDETREELAGKNAIIMNDYIDLIVRNPGCLFLIVSNPVDSLAQYLIMKVSEKTGKNKEEIAKKIIGVSCIDSMRLINLVREYVRDKFGIIDTKITGIALGEHGPSMVPLMSSVKIDNKLLSEMVSDEVLDNIAKQTILRGNDIIKLTGASSVLGPAHAVLYMIKEITRNVETILPCSCFDGKRSIGKMAKFIGNCFSEIIHISMTAAEKDFLNKSEEALDKQFEKILQKVKERETI